MTRWKESDGVCYAGLFPYQLFPYQNEETVLGELLSKHDFFIFKQNLYFIVFRRFLCQSSNLPF